MVISTTMATLNNNHGYDEDDDLAEKGNLNLAKG